MHRSYRSATRRWTKLNYLRRGYTLGVTTWDPSQRRLQLLSDSKVISLPKLKPKPWNQLKSVWHKRNGKKQKESWKGHWSSIRIWESNWQGVIRKPTVKKQKNLNTTNHRRRQRHVKIAPVIAKIEAKRRYTWVRDQSKPPSTGVQLDREAVSGVLSSSSKVGTWGSRAKDLPEKGKKQNYGTKRSSGEP